MKKRIVNASRPRLLPLAAGLAIALVAGSALAQPGPRAADGTFAQPHYMRGLAAKLAHRVHAALPTAPNATSFVTNCNDGGAGSLRNTVAGAASGDTIDLSRLHCARITLTSGAISTSLDDLTLRGGIGRVVIIDGNGADRVIRHDGAGTLTISDLVLQHGHYEAPYGNTYGGCVYSAGSVTLNRVVIAECAAVSSTASAYGGGLDVYGDLSMTASALIANSVRAPLHALAGGAAAFGNGTVRFSLVSGNSTYSNGDTSFGPYDDIDASIGGIGAVASIDIADSVICNNSATAHSDVVAHRPFAAEGGVLTFGALSLVRSTVSNNSLSVVATGSDSTTYGFATALGGGIRGAYVTITDSTINGNHVFASADNSAATAYAYSAYAYGIGGGVAGFGPYDTLVITNSTISGNSADHAGGPTTYSSSFGGAAYVRSYALEIANSTIAFNSATYGGGLAFRGGYSATLNSTIVAKNAPAVGGDISGIGTTAVTIGGANNLVGSVESSVTLPGGTISADPRLASLAFNGGPTLTHMLRSGSPAINAGNNAAGLMWDQRGPGFPRTVGRSTDIGAVEARGVH